MGSRADLRWQKKVWVNVKIDEYKWSALKERNRKKDSQRSVGQSQALKISKRERAERILKKEKNFIVCLKEY